MQRSILGYCLIFLFGICSTFGNSSANANPASGDSVYTGSIHHSNDLFVSPKHPFNLPFKSGSSPEEPKKFIETEQENDCDDDFFLLLWKNLSAYVFIDTASVKIHFFKLSQSFQNRSTLPLYIIFHSWKSFLV